MYFIESQHLKLVPLTNELLNLFCTDRHAFEKELGLQPYSMLVDPEYQLEMDDAMVNFWLPQTLLHPENYHWFTNWQLILKAENIAIGGIGFAGAPDDSGWIEIGFLLDQRQQGKGLMTEALQVMMNWAMKRGEVSGIRAQTYESNTPARKLLTSNNFQLKDQAETLLTYQYKPG